MGMGDSGEWGGGGVCMQLAASSPNIVRDGRTVLVRKERKKKVLTAPEKAWARP